MTVYYIMSMPTTNTNNYIRIIIHFYSYRTIFFVHLNVKLPLTIYRKNLYSCSLNKMHKTHFFVIVFGKLKIKKSMVYMDQILTISDALL